MPIESGRTIAISNRIQIEFSERELGRIETMFTNFKKKGFLYQDDYQLWEKIKKAHESIKNKQNQ